MFTNDSSQSNILDLTSKQTLFELAIEPRELLGHEGAKLIADLKDRAAEAEYTHMYFRDPIRPGIVWFTALGEDSGLALPTRGRLDQCRKMTDKIFPGFLTGLEAQVTEATEMGSDEEHCDEIILSQIPPLTLGVSGMELATALEYIVFVYPQMVRAWAALIFAYDQILTLKAGAESVREECIGNCDHAQIVSHLMSDEVLEA
ncbi:MAG: hypothetical protein AB1540_01605 [Bdellovibrionota bacterium]